MNPESDGLVQALTGKNVGGFVLGEHLNSGAFSYVFEAHDDSGGTWAAKILKPGINPQPAEEFRREAQLLRKLDGASNVVSLVDSGDFSVDAEINGIKVPMQFSYHILELASGCLDELVVNREKLTWEERIRLWRGIVRGVHQMHLNKVAHRDLKSSNCLVFIRGRDLSDSKVADLGRSRDLSIAPSHIHEQYAQGLGDLTFAPPEFLHLQGRDDPDAHLNADLYGLGSVFFELATGQSITGTAMEFGPSLVRRSFAEGLQHQIVDLAALRGLYVPAIDMLRVSLPASIRESATKLVRQLCDPLPAGRMPKGPANRKLIGKDRGLEWLLRRADILARSASARSVKSVVAQKQGA